MSMPSVSRAPLGGLVVSGTPGFGKVLVVTSPTTAAWTYPGFAGLALVTPGLVAGFRLGEASGTAAADVLGANNGTIVGSPTLGAAGLIEGDPDTAITLNGTTQHISLPNGLRPTGPFSFLVWVKAAAWAADGHILSDYTFTGAWQGAALWTAASGIPNLSIEGTQISGSALATGVPHELVGTYDGTNSRLYADGALVAGPTAVSAPSAADTLYIGAGWGGAFHFGGTPDEAYIYNRALAAAEVVALYASGMGR